MLNPPEGMNPLNLFEFYYGLNRKLVRYFLLGKINENSPHHLWLDVLKFMITVCGYSFVFIPQTYALISEPVSLATTLEACGVNLVIINTMCKLSVLNWQRKAIINQENSWKSLWKVTVCPDELLELCKYGRKAKEITCCYTILALATCCAYLIAPLIAERNDSDNVSMVPYMFAPPLKSNFSIISLYFVQVSISTVLYPTVVGADITVPVFIFHACGHLAALQVKLQNLGKRFTMCKQLTTSDYNGVEKNVHDKYANNADDFVKSELKECIRRHQIILGACKELENSFKLLGLIESICVVYHICFAGIGLLTVTSASFKFYVHIGAAGYQLLMFCWPTDSLITESLEIANTAFRMPWYDFPESVRSNICILIARSQEACSYTAGGFFVMSLAAYTNLLSNGFSAMAVFRTMS